jgi:hypothetical protein
LLKALFLPVNRIGESAAKWCAAAFVFIERPVIDHDLPSRTAGGRAAVRDTLKVPVIIWYCIFQKLFLLFFKCKSSMQASKAQTNYNKIACLFPAPRMHGPFHFAYTN